MSAAIQIRRATLDDLPRLIELWALERLPVSDYERRFKEFQVAQGADGEILGVGQSAQLLIVCRVEARF